MKKLYSKLIATFAFLMVSTSLFANTLTMDAKTFASELKTNKSLVIIDVLSSDVYAKQHIQGAINIPHKSLYKEGPVEGQFKDAAQLSDIFGKKGVSNTAKIVIYDDGSQKYNSRVWWILKYLGATDVYLLHKDMAQMEAARIPMTTSVVNLKPVVFEVSINSEMNIDVASLKAEMDKPGFLLLDAREKDEYDGLDLAKKSKGHLPGAVFMNFKEVLNEKGAYRTKEEIIEVAKKFGATPENEIIVYCQTGIKASVLYIALKEIAGFSNVKLYAGAYAEWASIEGNQIVN
ncbi:MAG: sulfurtransferase [Methanococcaceae archaeon]